MSEHDLDPAGDDGAPRYAIGVDLGTTHCALSYVDTRASDGEQAELAVLQVPQLSAPGTVESLALLPSFVYLPHESELAPGDLGLPWTSAQDFAVGAFARARGATTPIRMVASAKSWLCHPGVDRRGPILPADAPDELARISPFEASVRYLGHLREAWNAAHPDAPFDEQDVTVTIPASFDPVARELTAEAASAAGYARLTLLEEPQAALYSWIQNSAGAWRKAVRPGDIILVVDVGGGTTDLSLIAVVERNGTLEPHRVAVGDHILLGGDNMDLALAYGVVRKLAAQGTKLDAWQTRALSHACRAAKEGLLGDASLEAVPLVVPSRGSKLVGGSIRTELTRAELDTLLLDGFFPQVGVSEHPQARARSEDTSAQDQLRARELSGRLEDRRKELATLLVEAERLEGIARRNRMVPELIRSLAAVIEPRIVLDAVRESAGNRNGIEVEAWSTSDVLAQRFARDVQEAVRPLGLGVAQADLSADVGRTGAEGFRIRFWLIPSDPDDLGAAVEAKP